LFICNVTGLSQNYLVVSLNVRNTWSNPEQVRGLENVQVRAVSASGVVSAAIGSDGSLWVWGRSKRGQLGLGKDIVEAVVPSRVEALASYDIAEVLTFSQKLNNWMGNDNNCRNCRYHLDGGMPWH
jgi:alpha-tubulin suppressor-like RCC1 family protein